MLPRARQRWARGSGVWENQSGVSRRSHHTIRMILLASSSYNQVMIQLNSLSSQFIRPRYDEGGFAGIPNRIQKAFESGNYDAVVLFLIDGFGWRFFERFQDA